MVTFKKNSLKKSFDLNKNIKNSYFPNKGKTIRFFFQDRISYFFSKVNWFFLSKKINFQVFRERFNFVFSFFKNFFTFIFQSSLSVDRIEKKVPLKTFFFLNIKEIVFPIFVFPLFRLLVFAQYFFFCFLLLSWPINLVASSFFCSFFLFSYVFFYPFQSSLRLLVHMIQMKQNKKEERKKIKKQNYIMVELDRILYSHNLLKVDSPSPIVP